MTRHRVRRGRVIPLAMVAALSVAVGTSATSSAQSGSSAGDQSTATPIKHVVVIIGENHTFDNVFGTYQPPA
ncbi:MAG: hypothetical protein M3025_01235, partial [Actinomycetota bacterium]|nr:hypothetical protein [Actinomycetota bacterium]